jgi:hypothetical protein
MYIDCLCIPCVAYVSQFQDNLYVFFIIFQNECKYELRWRTIKLFGTLSLKLKESTIAL